MIATPAASVNAGTGTEDASSVTRMVTRRLRVPEPVLTADAARTPIFGTPGWRHVAAAAIAAGLVPATWFGMAWLSTSARLALIVFLLALVGWVLLRLDDTLVALSAAAALVLTEAIKPEQLYKALGDELVWLLVAAFILGAALKATGITERIAVALVRPARSVTQLFFILTTLIVATALVVPSTSGRAALLIPVFMALAETIDNPRIIRALALLFPTVILLSAGGSLIGAGAHLIALETIARLRGPSIDYLDWLQLGMPLAILLSLAATVLILAMFLTHAERRSRPVLPARTPAPEKGAQSSTAQTYVLGVLLLTVAAWSTESFHGVEMAIVAIIAAIAITIKPLSSVSLKDAMKGIEWGLLFFLAATLVLTNALMETGAAPKITKELVRDLKPWLRGQEELTVIAVATIAVVSHLLIPSRSARAAILVPTVALPLASLGYNPAALALLVVMGTGFCQTLPVSAKPVAMYGQLERPTYSKSDLLRLALVLMPVVLAATAVFALYVWPEQGLSLERRR